MELLEGVKARKSIRAFKGDPVPEQIIMDVLEMATRAPSGVNSQPWEFFVVVGETLRALKHANLEQYRLGKPPEPELPVGPTRGVAPAMEGVFKERQIRLAKQIFKFMEISKGDTEAQEKWNETMVQFYEAPAVIIIVMDRILQGVWPLLDIGLVAGHITLAAQAYDLGTCIMRAIVDYPEQVRKIVGIPQSKRIIVGIAIGYPDWDHPINQLRTEREETEKIVRILK
jgi:nitroreductase